MKILDTKPQVGIFEIVEGVLLLDTEDAQPINQGGGIFNGQIPHLHEQEIKVQVKYHSNISEETKRKFAINRGEYLKYPRGRVDFNVNDRTYSIISSRRFLEQPGNIELITRAFHLPSYSSGSIILEADESHYGY